MNDSTTTWMLVSDGAHGKVFRLNHAPRDWVLVAAFQRPEARAHVRDLVTDRAGRSQTPNRGTYGSGLAHGSPHDVELDRFARELAAFLDGHAMQRTYDRLVVAAPSRLLGRLRKLLGDAARQRVSLELVHDYTELAPPELDRRLAAAGHRAP